jgi:hypothetical protein
MNQLEDLKPLISARKYRAEQLTKMTLEEGYKERR